MAYVKPTKEQIEYAVNEEKYEREVAERGYTIVYFDFTDMCEIQALAAVFMAIDEDGDLIAPDNQCDDEDCAIEAERSGFCKIIPVDELPENFDRRYFGWVDTPENRKAIQEYCDKYCREGNRYEI